MRILFLMLLLPSMMLKAQSHWQLLYTYNNQLKSMWFTDPDTGYIAGNDMDSVFLKTTSGGILWDTLAPLGFPYTEIYFINADTGFCVAKNGLYGIYRTVDSGQTWNIGHSTGALIFEIIFPASNCGYAFEGVFTDIWVKKSIDQGNSWFQAEHITASNATVIGVQSTSFLDCNNGFIATDGGEIFKTTDAGNTWSLIYSNMSWALNGVVFFNMMDGVAIGKTKNPCADSQCGILLSTSDGGNTWNDSITDLQLITLAKAPSGKLLISAYSILQGKSYLSQSADSGLTFNIVDSNIIGSIQEIQMFDDSTGFLYSNFNAWSSSYVYGMSTSTGINDLKKEINRVYPNPFDRYLILETDNQSLKSIDIKIMNNLGYGVFHTSTTTTNEGKLQLDLPELVPGFYYLVITEDNTRSFHRIIRK